MFSFKRADVSEIKEIQQLAHQTWPLAYEALLGKEQVSYMLDLIYNEEALKQQFAEGHYFYFIYADDELCGFASFGRYDDDVWKLFKIYILPGRQGSGTGKALLDFVIRKVISEGASELILNVNRHNKARHFYEKNGFRIVEEVDINIGNGYFMNDYIMSLTLHEDE